MGIIFYDVVHLMYYAIFVLATTSAIIALQIPEGLKFWFPLFVLITICFFGNINYSLINRANQPIERLIESVARKFLSIYIK